MRQVLFSLICISTLVAGSAGQMRDSFDIATYQAPAGWTKQSKENGVIFTSSDQQNGAFAMLVLYRSQRSSGDPKQDFNADWSQFVADDLGAKDKPQMEPLKQLDGWTITIGASTFESDDLGKAAVILSTYTGYGRKFSATAIFNRADYGPAIEAFAGSIVLDKAALSPQAPPIATQVENSILGTWGQNLGAHMTYGDPVAAGMAGYSKDQYTFKADGTYTFLSKTFRMGYDKIILVVENGNYRISGDALSIRPQKSVIQAWSKLNGGDGWGRMLSTQPRKLEAVTYKFTRHYFSGINEWNLVLQADQPTERDGPFSTFKLFPNAWYYKPISANNPVIVLPK